MSVISFHYIDSSALVKLIVEESESEALRAYLRMGGDPISSELVRVEVPRAVVRQGRPASDADGVLAELTLVPVLGEVLDTAARLRPAELRSLDAIHLATALALQTDLDAIVTYDARMQAAAHDLGLTVIAPA